MATLQYNFDKGAATDSFADFLHSQNYTKAFEQALLNADPDQTGFNKQVDIKVLDLYGEKFTKAYDAAYITTNDAADSTDQVALDKARIILFDKNLDSVDVDLAGSKSHFIAATQGDDNITIGGGKDQVIDAGGGSDFVQTGKGNDLIFAGDGEDIVFAGRGNDTIFGGAGDHLSGERGDDSIVGGGGDATIDGGSGFDVAVVDGKMADFHYTGHAWVNSLNGDQISNVEYTELNDGLLITVGSVKQAALARLFQAVNDHDPTAADYKSALVALNNGQSLENIAKNLVDENDTLAGPAPVGASEKGAFVKDIVNNLFDGSTGAWDQHKIDDYVSTLPNWSKAKIVADLVTKISAADDHIGIHIDTSNT